MEVGNLKKLISISPHCVEYIESIEKTLGGNKFSMAIEKICDEHSRMKEINQLKKDIQEVKVEMNK